MDYYESAEDVKINRKRVLIEFNKHNTSEEDQKEFFSLYTDECDEFEAQCVLRFLGY